MSDRQPFIDSILAAPDDDGPRLVYADWLEEHEECDRAEFIRLGCELARLKAGLDSGYGGRGVKGRGVNAIKALHRREREFLSLEQDRVREEWRVTCGGGDVWWEAWEFRRGFVHALTCSWEDCSAHLDAILKEQPVLEVRLTTRPPEFSSDGWSEAEMLKCFAERWPTVKFTLPQQGRRATATFIDEDAAIPDLPSSGPYMVNVAIPLAISPRLNFVMSVRSD